MTRKDFEKIADCIRTLDLYMTLDYNPAVNDEKRKQLATHFANELAETNGEFKKQKFINRCMSGPHGGGR